MKQQHHPWHSKTVHRGANTDIEPEHVSRMEGVYVDAQNMRVASNQGNDGALFKIGGEVVKWVMNELGQEGYECIGETRVKDIVVAFWAHPEAQTYPPVITIDGTVMVMSFQLPYTTETILQLAHTEDCEYGLVFDARSNGIPLVFDIEAIVTAYNNNEETFFAEFNIEQLQVNLSTPVDRPRFYNLVDVGQGGGMYPGNYYYAIRYANQSGDVTAIGPEVGPIYIPIYTNGPGAPSFPSAGLQGASSADFNTKTNYGARLKFRVNNKADFERIQLIRIQYNAGDADEGIAATVLAKEWIIAPQQISVIEYVDNGDFTEIAPIDEAQEQRFYIVRANSVRYINYRIVYGGIEVASKIVNLDFTEVGGNKAFPFTKNIGIKGHADPVNNCYYRRFMSGEKYGFGVQLYDPAGGRTFVTPIPGLEDYQFPNRRDEKTGDSLLYSGADSYCWAANTDTLATDRVTPTFEVFDHDNATQKVYTENFVNCMTDGGRPVLLGNPSAVPTGISNNPAVYTSPTANGAIYKTSYGLPLTPTSASDTDKSGLNYKVNTAVQCDAYAMPDPQNQPFTYNPKVFDVSYHTMGVAVRGINQIPDWVEGFSIVRSKPANRVVAQAIATYDIQEGTITQGQGGQIGNDYKSATKSKSSIVLNIPEYDANGLTQTFVEDIRNNPQNYSIQFVSPLGYCTEQYGGANFSDYGAEAGPLPNDIIIDSADLISYARILWDTGQINPDQFFYPFGASATIAGTPGNQYVDYGSWGTAVTPNNAWRQLGSALGNKEFSISSASWSTENRATRLGVTLNEEIYDYFVLGKTIMLDDPDPGFIPGIGYGKPVREPFYVVNIIQNGKIADTQTGYVSCNHYQKIKSVIGVYSGGTQDFEIIDERIDDILPGPSGVPCYIYSNDKRLLCDNGLGNISLLVQAISQNGSVVDPYGNTINGFYSVVNQFGENYVRINSSTGFLQPGDLVQVRYNSSIPIKVYGDTLVQPAICGRVDRATNYNPDNSSFEDTIYILGGTPSGIPIPSQQWWSCFGSPFQLNGAPLPFNTFHMNPRYYVPWRGDYSGDVSGPGGDYYYNAVVNQSTSGLILSIRQWVVMFDCEMRTPIVLAPDERTASENPNAALWPQVNYVQRPAAPQDSSTLSGNGLHANYQNLHPFEYKSMTLGGFKFLHSDNKINLNYRSVRDIQFFSKPEFGFIEQTKFCSALIWSNRAAPTIQNSPGLRTFPVTNIYFIQNDTGTIQRLYSSPSGAGFNLYALTDRGVVMILVNKSIAYSADGESFSLLKNDGFILDNSEVWIARSVGMPGNYYRTAAEGSAFLGEGAIRQECLFWWNGESAFILSGNSVLDIAKGRYRKAMTPGPGVEVTKLNGVFDQLNDEYWCGINDKVFVYSTSPGVNSWTGYYTYDFDRFLHMDGITYGLRDGGHWVLDQGSIISGEPVEGWIKEASALLPGSRMEWIRYKAVSTHKPDRVEFRDENDAYRCALDPSNPEQGSLYLKLEDGWEQYVPRTDSAVDIARKRLQGRLMYHITSHKSIGPFKVISLHIQTKPIK